MTCRCDHADMMERESTVQKETPRNRLYRKGQPADSRGSVSVNSQEIRVVAEIGSGDAVKFTMLAPNALVFVSEFRYGCDSTAGQLRKFDTQEIVRCTMH